MVQVGNRYRENPQTLYDFSMNINGVFSEPTPKNLIQHHHRFILPSPQHPVLAFISPFLLLFLTSFIFYFSLLIFFFPRIIFLSQNFIATHFSMFRYSITSTDYTALSPDIIKKNKKKNNTILTPSLRTIFNSTNLIRRLFWPAFCFFYSLRSSTG